MTRVRAASVAFGVVFGLLLSWSRVTDPDVIRAMLRLADPYVYLLMASAVGVGFVGVRLLRRARARAVLTGEPVSWSTARPERRHVVGSVLFGIGWAIADACPGPIMAQIGQGFGWALVTVAGVVVGVLVYLWREEPEHLAAGGAYASAPE